MKKLLRLIKNKIKKNLLSFIFRKNLVQLAIINKTDKWGEHWYANHYQNHFAHLRKKKLVILEIGVGGYDNPYAGGESLRMWRSYFVNSLIVGLDIHEKKISENRIKIFQGDQTDENTLCNIVNKVGKPDIIIDDGSHVNEHVIKTFQYMFPQLSENGIYVIEDLQTSYWPQFGGNSDLSNKSSTSINMLKSFLDCLHHEELMINNYEPSYYDNHITSLHLYHNIAFIKKGLNNEGSNRISKLNRENCPSANKNKI
jgi:demethylmacrocin O-methyltransferase